MSVFVFPGQGSQHQGMGGELFERYADLTATADDILGYSIQRLCLENPRQKLRQTEYTQPAVYVVNALSYLDSGAVPDYVAGHSLGEYNALHAAGVFDFETGLRLVRKRGELMSRMQAGSMAAVIGLAQEKIEQILADNGFDDLDIANYNAPDQIVVSGSVSALEQAHRVFRVAGARVIPLNVGAAFHSRFMQPASEQFAEFLSTFEFAELQRPVISNLHATPYRWEKIGENLQQQITRPVRWTQTIRYLLQQGEKEFHEIGPGRVLTGLLKTIREQTAECAAIGEPARINPPQNSRAPVISARTLGSGQFKQAYGIQYAYVAGAMYKGIASSELVIRMARAGLLAYFGSGGLSLDEIEQAIRSIQQALGERRNYGINLLCHLDQPQQEEQTVDLFLRYGIRHIEASAYIQLTPALVRFRVSGLQRDSDGTIVTANRVLAKISRPEVAAAFLSPAPERILNDLLNAGRITGQEAQLARHIPMADDLCVEADSAGHTDRGVTATLLPAMLRLRDEYQEKFRYRHPITVGSAGGIGTPQAAAAAFMLGADFILTGSINQCTVEAGNSAEVKQLLQQMDVQDTDYAPAGDMFELGAKVQVLRKGVFFPARANRLYELYRRYAALDEIPPELRQQLEQKYFRRSFEAVYEETRAHYLRVDPYQIDKAERDPKHKMALIFRWYFIHTMRLALQGDVQHKVDYQIHCGSALGAFNRWIRGSDWEDWRNRHVDAIARKLMEETARLLNQRFNIWLTNGR
jgi:trans-AT polyketide synthase/acyltransferase/oxidoreductase domain-containing protein